MSLPKIEEVRSLSDEEIAEQILAAKKELFELRLQQATGKLEKTHLFKHKRHRLGQLFTVERERQLVAGKAETEPDLREKEETDSPSEQPTPDPLPPSVTEEAETDE